MVRRKRPAVVSVPDIRTPKDLKGLKDLLKAHPITLVLVYADWCGHCTNYKNATWKELKETPDRTVGMAELNSDILNESPFANAKIQGYPSVLVVGKDGKPAEFVEDGEATNALPNSRDTNAMKEMVTAPASTLNAATGANNAFSPVSSLDLPPSSVDPTPPLKSNASIVRANSNAGTLPPVNMNSLAAPDLEEDVLRSQNRPPATVSAAAAAADFPMAGGSLYAALLDAGKLVAPAAALTTAAVLVNRRKSRKGGRGRGRSRSSRKLRNHTLKRFLNAYRRK